MQAQYVASTAVYSFTAATDWGFSSILELEACTAANMMGT
jgi:hypothetical protein